MKKSLYLIFLLFTACASIFTGNSQARLEKVRLGNLWIVYASHERINQECIKKGYTKKVKGFYDPDTNTIWCEKTDYHTCGHELRHAVGENWHR